LGIHGVDKIVFIDDTFNAFNATLRERCLELKKHKVKWFSFIRANLLDEDSVKLMKESGCVAVYLGIESANDLVLRNMNKKATASEFMRGVGLLKRHGITVMAAFIIGFPGETGSTIKENIRFIDDSGLDLYTLKEFYYMPHTPVHADRAKYGLSGQGAKWTHGTMDSLTAGSKKLEIFAEVKNSLYVDADTNLWYIAYLYDMGYHIKDILDIQE
jgi:p-methyltransferase